MEVCKSQPDKKKIIRRCHVCGEVNQSEIELQRCGSCSKSFLPLQYFSKIHDKKGSFDHLFSRCDELNEQDLVKGLFVLW